jgi:enoyl-CoA hydratase/carnithine racemase
MGRTRALEVMLSPQVYDAEPAEPHGSISRTLPADALDDFVRSLARRIAGFPGGGGNAALKGRVSAIARSPETQGRCGAAKTHGFQTRGGEMVLARMPGDLPGS